MIVPLRCAGPVSVCRQCPVSFCVLSSRWLLPDWTTVLDCLQHPKLLYWGCGVHGLYSVCTCYNRLAALYCAQSFFCFQCTDMRLQEML
jgi:hypothetical protein